MDGFSAWILDRALWMALLMEFLNLLGAPDCVLLLWYEIWMDHVWELGEIIKEESDYLCVVIIICLERLFLEIRERRTSRMSAAICT